MSFGEDKPGRIRALEEENANLREVALFMADRLDSFGFPRLAPASWGYIERELGRLGMEVRR